MFDNRIIEKVTSDFLPLLDVPTGEFLQRCLSKDSSVYEERLKAIGFHGLENVLDFGCGFGQWTLCLSAMNGHVDACDTAAERLLFLDRLVNQLDLSNVSVARGTLIEHPYEFEKFDAIFTYNVLTILPWREALAIFHQLLKPGGRLYLNGFGIGWQCHRWVTSHNAVRGFSPREKIPGIFEKTWLYDQGLPIPPHGDMIIDPEALVAELTSCGFKNISLGGDGTLRDGLYEGPSPEKFYEETYYDLPGVFEVLCSKGLS